MKRYDLYYLNDFQDKYPAFSEESADGEWISFEDVLPFLRAFVDIMDGIQDHDIQGETGLPDTDCELIAKCRKEAKQLLAVSV